MRTIGIDLAMVGDHKAVIHDNQGEVVGQVFSLRREPSSLDELLRRARQGVAEDEPLRAVMEPTGLAWLSVASYLSQRRVTVYLVNTQQVSDLRKFYKKHAKSDRIDAWVLARLPWVNPEALHPLQLSPADHLSGQRWCKQQEELADFDDRHQEPRPGFGVRFLARPGGGGRQPLGPLGPSLARGVV